MPRADFILSATCSKTSKRYSLSDEAVLRYAPMKLISRLVAGLSLFLFACEEEKGPQPIAFPQDPPDLGFSDAGTPDEVARLCQPGSRRCVDETSPFYEVCGPNGAYFDLEACEPGQICRDRRCVDFACRASESICLGTRSVATCASDGRSYENESECPNDSVCRAGTCVDLCANAENEGSYIGCEYTATRLFNLSEEDYAFAIVVGNPNRFLSLNVSLSSTNQEILLAQDTPKTSEIIDESGATWPIESVENVVVPPRNMAVFVLDIRNNTPIKIKSTRPVVAAQFNPYCCNQNYSNDASLLFPDYTLGTRYRLTNYPAFGELPAEAIVIAQDADTTVSWQDLGNTYSQRVDANASFTIRSQTPDISGIEINSSHPVSVFSSHPCTFIPDQLWACDHLESQLLPADALGSQYILSPMRIRSDDPEDTTEGIYWWLTADEDVEVSFDPPLSSLNLRPTSSTQRNVCRLRGGTLTLEAGESCEIGLYEPTSLSASGRLSVAGFLSGQESTGKQFFGTQAGDPAMFLLPPIDRLRTDYSFISPPTYAVNYITVAAPANAVFLLDGEQLKPESMLQAQTVQVNSQRWKIFTVRISAGVHRIESAQPFQLLVYAYDDYVSYAYVGGLDLGPKQ